MTPENQDECFTAKALDALPAVAASPGLHRAVMAGFDAFQARRQTGLGATLRGFSEAVWPGAPVWAPGSVLAAALVIGIGVGFALPDPGERIGFSFDEPSAFSLLLPDATESL